MHAATDDHTLTTDPARLDVPAIHASLSRRYWSPGLPLQVVQRALAHSLCSGLLRGDEQVGLARVVTDRATFAHRADVHVLEAHRGAAHAGAQENP